MPKRESSAPLYHMLDHAREACALVRNRTRQELETDRLLNLALVRLLEIIGEAASRVTPAQRARSSEIPWLQIVGMRNRLIHGYDSLDFNILWQTLWQTVMEDLPPLIVALEGMLSSHHERS
jgi:uncharacterized protein with HEPN domain